MRKFFALRGIAVMLVAQLAVGNTETPGRRQVSVTTAPLSPDAFSSAVAALISSYIPASVLIPIANAIQSAASAAGTTGDIQDILITALAGTAPPTWLTAIPTEYQSPFADLESAISSLKSGVISNAASLSTTTPLGSTSTPTRSQFGNSLSSVRSTTFNPERTSTGGTLSPVATQTSAKSSTNTGAIVGGVVGGVAVICATVFGLAFLKYKQKAAPHSMPANDGRPQIQEYPTYGQIIEPPRHPAELEPPSHPAELEQPGRYVVK
ncbi:MAG: hypothetical protein M1813_009522 [Trichoglossum hirsutum]|nr:MAG: hypothetical protein M1813_009522 [Trichoglossum hirsutum]